ncbi:hypothetical protein D9757_011438 [Collybiopsis confluens]|uniref:Uncharacterized protein n=1 Tax=Collybiopsis confluens TaxID=2823264 RepID=A0A8H5GH84_9AGAR|nr:hypothetical protein D9757_013566 [Collybiopsis confluens]KAF5365029.1 hypothetical protein D9757_011438 [Collybiopsis confluens]
MAASPLEMFIDVVMNDIPPTIASHPIFSLILVFILLIVLWALHVLLCRLSLRHLSCAIKVSNKLLEEYKESLLRHFLCDTVDCEKHKNCYKDYERRFFAIEKIAHTTSEVDYKVAFWKKYISPGRAVSIASGYRELCALNKDIEQSRANVLKDHNDYMIQKTCLRRRYTPDTPLTFGSEDK